MARYGSGSPVDRQADSAFKFVRMLAAELSAGQVDIPSFPDIAIRVRRVLSDGKVSIEQVTRVVGSEPALAARLIRIANSASFNRSGRPVVELRTAINRIGYNLVRSAAIAFAMAQIRSANQLKELDPRLEDLWQRSTLVAALSYVLARTLTRMNPDEALLTGMMHGIGELYVLTRAAEHPELFANSVTLNGIVSDWHPAIGKAILENWGFSEDMAHAIGEQQNDSRMESGAPDLRDLIAVALLLASHFPEPAAFEVDSGKLPAVRRLGLDATRTAGVMQDCAQEVAALNEALAG